MSASLDRNWTHWTPADFFNFIGTTPGELTNKEYNLLSSKQISAIRYFVQSYISDCKGVSEFTLIEKYNSYSPLRHSKRRGFTKALDETFKMLGDDAPTAQERQERQEQTLRELKEKLETRERFIKSKESEIELLRSSLSEFKTENSTLLSQIEALKDKPRSIVFHAPSEEKLIKLEKKHSIFPELFGALLAGLNVLLVGPAGSGKTTIAEQISKELSLDFYFTPAVAAEHKLSGYKDAHGLYHTTSFRLAYEFGGVFLFDEMDGSAPAALLYVNAALANGYQEFPDKIIKKNPKFLCIAAANTFGQGANRLYVGRNQLDAASLDRFYTVSMNYDEELEQELFGGSAFGASWLSFCQATRKRIDELQIRHIVSMRAIGDGIKAKEVGLSNKQILSGCLYKHLSESEISKIQSATGGFTFTAPQAEPAEALQAEAIYVPSGEKLLDFTFNSQSYKVKINPAWNHIEVILGGNTSKIPLTEFKKITKPGTFIAALKTFYTLHNQP